MAPSPGAPLQRVCAHFRLIVAIKGIMYTVRCSELQVVRTPQGLRTGCNIKLKIFSISSASLGTFTASAAAVQTGSDRAAIGPRTTVKLWLLSNESPNALLFDGGRDVLFVIRAYLCLYN